MSARHRDDESCGMTGTSPHPAGMTARGARDERQPPRQARPLDQLLARRPRDHRRAGGARPRTGPGDPARRHGSLSYHCSPLSPMNGPSWPPTPATAGNPRRCDYEPGTTCRDPANPLIPDERDPGPRLGLIGPLGHPTKTKTKTSARCRQRTPSERPAARRRARHHRPCSAERSHDGSGWRSSGGAAPPSAGRSTPMRTTILPSVLRRSMTWNQPSALADDEQSANSREPRDLVLQRPVRKGARHRRPPRPGAGEHALEAFPTLHHQLEPLLSGIGDELQPPTGTLQPPVERVERCVPHYARPADRQLEGRGQQVVQGLGIERRGAGGRAGGRSEPRSSCSTILGQYGVGM